MLKIVVDVLNSLEAFPVKVEEDANGKQNYLLGQLRTRK